MMRRKALRLLPIAVSLALCAPALAFTIDFWKDDPPKAQAGKGPKSKAKTDSAAGYQPAKKPKKQGYTFDDMGDEGLRKFPWEKPKGKVHVTGTSKWHYPSDIHNIHPDDLKPKAQAGKSRKLDTKKVPEAALWPGPGPEPGGSGFHDLDRLDQLDQLGGGGGGHRGQP